ncbi:sugar transferase [Aeribacillus sp. FSL M8-0254]|uniref:sugar transferase n=1 Tax=Aeribacillus sp. FSL M8-0254 TaxID=2954577 RepID=UPI0030F9F3DF
MTKRTMDIVGAIIGLILTSPLFLIISIFYLFGDSKGPIFFKQIRVGKNGKKFYIYKFRSMIVKAEEKLKADKELYEKYLRNNYKLEPHEDPRITNLGRFLRKTSLDEIPQLINVLKGEMSLVGPRPVVFEELREYGNRVNEFLSVKPGITGYWAVSGRSSIDYPERVNLELFYIYNQSLMLDLKIILKTFIGVISGKGAY